MHDFVEQAVKALYATVKERFWKTPVKRVDYTVEIPWWVLLLWICLGVLCFYLAKRWLSPR